MGKVTNVTGTKSAS